jgi:hypothetical protein
MSSLHHRQYLISSETTQNTPYFKIPNDLWMNVLSFLPSKDISYLAINSPFIFNTIAENAQYMYEKLKETESDIIWQFMEIPVKTRKDEITQEEIIVELTRMDKFHNAVHFINLSYVYQRSTFPKDWYNELYFNETEQQISFLRGKEQNKWCRQLMSLLMYYNFPIYYAHRCIRLKEPQLKFMLEHLKEHGNKSDGVKYDNPYSGAAYYYLGSHQKPEFLEIVTKLTSYGYDPLVISSMVKHYRPKSMAVMFDLMNEGVDKDVVYELAKISNPYTPEKIQHFLYIKKELSSYEVMDKDVLQVSMQYPEQIETFIIMIKAGIPSSIALNFGIKETMLPAKEHIQAYIDIIREALTQYNVSEETLIMYFEKYQYTRLYIDDMHFLRHLFNYYTSRQQIYFVLYTIEADDISHIKKDLRNKNISGIQEFPLFKNEQYIIFLNFSLYQQQIFRAMYVEADLRRFFIFHPHGKIDEMLTRVSALREPI